MSRKDEQHQSQERRKGDDEKRSTESTGRSDVASAKTKKESHGGYLVRSFLTITVPGNSLTHSSVSLDMLTARAGRSTSFHSSQQLVLGLYYL